MSIVDKKRDFLAKIASVKALANVKKDNINSSFSSINNELNSTNFLIDLVTALVGAKALRDYVIDTISYKLPEIEEAVKEGLKLELKKLCSCNINPSIPDWLKHPTKGGTGVDLKVTEIDFFDIMKVNPTSFEGGLIYTDTSNGVNSQDFNTYLYNTIQTPGTATQWGNSVGSNDIITATFIPDGTSTGKPNNIVNYTASVDYSDKKLSDFNNDYIDSLSMFGNPGSKSSSKIISSIMEELFGSISSITNKGKKQLMSEIGFKKVLDSVLELETPKVPDSVFKFDKATLAKIDRESNDRKKGVRELKTEVITKVGVGAAVVSDSMAAIDSASNKIEEVSAIKDSLNNATQAQTNSALTQADEETIKTNFFTEIIKKLKRIIMSSIMGPEFITIFAINYKIVHGQNSGYDDPLDFIKKNRTLVKSIGKIILNILLNLLLNIVLAYIAKLLKEKFIDDKIEKAKNHVSILLSYSGVPPSVIAQIRKLSARAIPDFKI